MRPKSQIRNFLAAAAAAAAAPAAGAAGAGSKGQCRAEVEATAGEAAAGPAEGSRASQPHARRRRWFPPAGRQS